GPGTAPASTTVSGRAGPSWRTACRRGRNFTQRSPAQSMAATSASATCGWTRASSPLPGTKAGAVRSSSRRTSPVRAVSGKTELARLAALPASEWKGAVIARAGRYRRPRMHQDMVKLTGISAEVRQIAIKNIGRDQPTLLITNDTATKTKDLFARYAERMMVENELDAYIGGFHLDALTSGVSLNVDLDATLTVVAGNLYRLLARKLPRYHQATPETLWRDFLDATGTLHIDETGVTCALNLRSHHPILIHAGFADL